MILIISTQGTKSNKLLGFNDFPVVVICKSVQSQATNLEAKVSVPITSLLSQSGLQSLLHFSLPYQFHSAVAQICMVFHILSLLHQLHLFFRVFMRFLYWFQPFPPRIRHAISLCLLSSREALPQDPPPPHQSNKPVLHRMLNLWKVLNNNVFYHGSNLIFVKLHCLSLQNQHTDFKISEM